MIRFVAGLVTGCLLSLYFVRTAMRRLVKESEQIDPLDYAVTVVAYDEEGNELTRPALVSLGEDGSNTRPVIFKVIKSGVVHHAVVRFGRLGAVVSVDQPVTVSTDELFVIDVGNWSTVF